MKTEAIIFDKDGTLLDFDAFWISVSRDAVADVLNACGCTGISVDEILELLGVNDGVTSIEGVLCKGTYAQMGQIVCAYLDKHGYKTQPDAMVRLITDMYVKNVDAGEIVPTCPDLPQMMTRLKEKGLKLAVVTTDNREITLKCLTALGIAELMDIIYTDDGQMPTKPNSACLEDFCCRFGLRKENVVMVGDTLTDVAFANNAGISMIGVGKKAENREILRRYIDTVVPDISYLEAII